MKKIILALAVLISFNSYSQTPSLDTVNVSLTLRAGDWAYGVGKYGAGTDSLSRLKVRAIRTAIMAAAPASWNTNVTITVPGVVVMYLYNIFVYTPFSEVLEMGSNTAARTTIYNNIRAINNSAIQYYIGLTDGGFISNYENTRQTGKQILLDN